MPRLKINSPRLPAPGLKAPLPGTADLGGGFTPFRNTTFGATGRPGPQLAPEPLRSAGARKAGMTRKTRGEV